jgi:hypothetical protein
MYCCLEQLKTGYLICSTKQLIIGSYPMSYGESSIMGACMVGNDTQCKESWEVNAINCGDYNIVYLEPTVNCGRYCMGK